ncbi:MAG: thioredoxin [Muribaculaceae bacterium]|nr:thioredoxin [Muribaculaceae bacterium]
MADFNEMINSDKPTLVDFFATWCGPCRMQAPILEQVKSKVGDAANVIKIDIDQNSEVATRYRVQSVPTLIVFVNGEAVWRGVGVHQADQLEAKLREHMPK